jgi:hypothetical protein
MGSALLNVVFIVVPISRFLLQTHSPVPLAGEQCSSQWIVYPIPFLKGSAKIAVDRGKREGNSFKKAGKKGSYHFLLYTSVMQKRLTVKPHLSLEEVEQQYRTAKDPIARSHWQIVWLLAASAKPPSRSSNRTDTA